MLSREEKRKLSGLISKYKELLSKTRKESGSGDESFIPLTDICYEITRTLQWNPALGLTYYGILYFEKYNYEDESLDWGDLKLHFIYNEDIRIHEDVFVVNITGCDEKDGRFVLNLSGYHKYHDNDWINTGKQKLSFDID